MLGGDDSDRHTRISQEVGRGQLMPE
jgi:hypothetical protein